jgi:hypothetical protein
MRLEECTPLGHARVYRHDRTGELVVDTDTIRRSSFAGDELGRDDDYDDDDYDDDDEEFEGDDDLGDDDLGDDDLGDDDLGDDDLGDDETGDEELGEDFAGPRRLNRRKNRLEKRLERIDKRLNRKQRRRGRKSKMTWGMTAVGGVDTVSEEGAATVKIRLQHHFKAEDVTFTGSASGATVTSIFFGDRVVWSNSDGIDVSVFASNSFMRGLLRGQSLRAGLDITVNGAMPSAGNFSVTIIGKKPLGRRR